ncbi:hypothetical protein POM88_035269 [Heracleum sosnowskyi]|uniref:SWIM-type domain-containing protein n=1 Tax=Heracleum sosnowskyi TaxID=360622 RepID=A0AAD8HN10_9APIA|nr:hypothetical protein POM88_035269 [Heracleum sosnowskyi]
MITPNPDLGPSRPIPRLEAVSLRLGLCKTTPEGGLDPGGASGVRISNGFGKEDRTIEKSKYGGCESGLRYEFGLIDGPGLRYEFGLVDEPGLQYEFGLVDEPGLQYEFGLVDEPGLRYGLGLEVQHGGQWNENEIYVNFKVCGLLIPRNCTYSNLVGMIYNELRLHPESATLKIEYQVRDDYPPFNIVDDSQLLFYLELKKKEPDFTRYPLCLTNECVASNSLHEQEGEVVVDVVADYVDYAELISCQILDISNEKENEDEAIQVENEVNPTNNVLFEVQNGDKKSIVDLGLRTCTCNRFQMDQLPCAHAIAVFKK